MDKVGKELGIKNYQDWYSVDFEKIVKHGASYLVNAFYGGSPAKAISSIYSGMSVCLNLNH